MTELDTSLASAICRTTLAQIRREWPNKLDHIMAGVEDVERPSVLHPIFYGCMDWHSCVHGWWRLLRLARLFPDMPEVSQIRAVSDEMLRPEYVAGEIAYLERPTASTFERPYGWGWALALHHEAERHDAPWGSALAPWAQMFADRFKEYLPKLTYPIRVGTHYNTAFALTLALEWAAQRDMELAATIGLAARGWFFTDSGCQAWEPSGDDFLSPALTEALLMSRVMSRTDFRTWLDDFLPDMAEGKPTSLFHPVSISDRSDGKIAHLDGLNLSRAWCWKSIMAALDENHSIAPRVGTAIADHISASLPHIFGDYTGEHFLGSFALLALHGDR
jgi:hypothetical protein